MAINSVKPNPQKQLRIGLLGCGFMGKCHTNAYKKIPYIYAAAKVTPRLAVLCDQNRELVEREALLALAPYLARLGTESLKARLLPAAAQGKAILAVAMTEPQAGSDLAGLTTRAVEDGDADVVAAAEESVELVGRRDRHGLVAGFGQIVPDGNEFRSRQSYGDGGT